MRFPGGTFPLEQQVQYWLTENAFHCSFLETRHRLLHQHISPTQSSTSHGKIDG